MDFKSTQIALALSYIEKATHARIISLAFTKMADLYEWESVKSNGDLNEMRLFLNTKCVGMSAYNEYKQVIDLLFNYANAE